MATVLKITYDDGSLIFKGAAGYSFKENFRLDLGYENSLSFLKDLREMIRNGRGDLFKDYDRYTLNCSYSRDGVLKVSAFETRGEKGGNAGSGEYNMYMSGKDILYGLSKAISEIRDGC